MTTESSEPVGLIGIGLLGSALAERLLSAGFEILGFDLDPQRREELRQLGGTPAASAVEVARQCRRIVLCLPNSTVVRTVLTEIQPHLRGGALIVDTTTGDPDDMAEFARQLLVAGAGYLDATVSGSSHQVRQGEAILLVGGCPAEFAAAQDILSAIARQVFHVGPSGSGARMKLVVNLALGLERAVLAEALVFAERCGLDPAGALEILKASPAYCRVMDLKGPKMLSREFAPQARLSQHLKDVRLILQTARRCGAAVPLSELHCQLLEEAEQLGYGSADNSAIIEVFRARSVRTVRSADPAQS